MKPSVIIVRTGLQSKLIGKYYGANNEDIVFFAGSHQDCIKAAAARHLIIEKTEVNIYHTMFSKDQFNVGDKIAFYEVNLSVDCGLVCSPHITTMVESIGQEFTITNSEYWTLKDARNTVGRPVIRDSKSNECNAWFYCYDVIQDRDLVQENIL